MEKTKQLHSSYRVETQAMFKGSWLQLQRPMTWSGTISPILAGTAFAAIHHAVDYIAMLILLVAALLIQASANMLNDYFDFKNGQDQERWIGEYTSEDYSHQPLFHQIPWVAMGAFSVAIVLGLWITTHFGWWIAMVGIIGMIAGCLYSAGKKSLAAIGLGELTGVIFLGFVPFILGYAVQHQPLSWDVFIVALPFAFLITVMIMTNNVRDIKKDEGFRRTVPMRIGRKTAVALLSSIVIGVYMLIFLLVGMQFVSWPVLIVVFALPMAMKLLMSFRENISIEERNLGMKWAALHHWIFGLLYVVGIWISSFIVS